MPLYRPFSGPNGCPTSADSPIFTSALECSGHGRCVEASCVCDKFWYGVSDMLNLDGLDCHNPEILTRGLWALAVVMWLRLLPVHKR